MPSTNFRDIRKAIVDKLNSAEITKIQVAYNTDRSTFDGFPAAVVTPTKNEADYHSTALDKLTYTFEVRLYSLFENEDEQQQVEETMDDAVDEFLSVFSNRDALGIGFEQLRPVASQWEYEIRGEAMYRVVTLMLDVVEYVEN